MIGRTTGHAFTDSRYSDIGISELGTLQCNGYRRLGVLALRCILEQ